MRNMPENVVFLSGVHGTGKSTLKENLLKLPYIINYDKCEMTSFDQIFERQIRRIAKYRIDYERICKLALENPHKIILTDRCILDAYAYLKAFYDLQWLEAEDYNDCLSMIESLFPNSKMFPKHILMLNPPLDKIKEWINKRQNEVGTKWNEKDMRYLEVTYNAYNRLSNPAIKRIEDVDLNKRIEVCTDYLDDLFYQLTIPRGEE